MLIVPNQKCSYKSKKYEPGLCYEVSTACAKKLVGDKKAKVITGGQPKIKTRIPKLTNRDPMIERD